MMHEAAVPVSGDRWYNLTFPQRPAFLFCGKANGAAVCGLQLKQCQDVKLRFDARDVVNHA